jgi:hypothetical protein
MMIDPVHLYVVLRFEFEVACVRFEIRDYVIAGYPSTGTLRDSSTGKTGLKTRRVEVETVISVTPRLANVPARVEDGHRGASLLETGSDGKPARASTNHNDVRGRLHFTLLSRSSVG